jgi:hypothetical protein
MKGNIAVGATDTECVTTNNDASVSVSDLGNPAKVVVRVDDYSGIAPFTTIASINVPTNLRPYDKYNAVAFDQLSRREAYERLKQLRQDNKHLLRSIIAMLRALHLKVALQLPRSVNS